MPLVLTVIQGPANGQQIVITPAQSPRTIGRSPVADVCVPDEWLEDRHFAVYFDGARAVLRDLRSTHGTYVNGSGVQECALNEGDQVAAGQSFFVASLVPEVAAVPDDEGALTGPELYEAMSHGPRDRVRWALRDEDKALFAVVDVATEAGLIEKINRSGEQFCAFDETADPQDPGSLAPVLVSLSHESDLLVELLDEAWGKGAMVFLTSERAFHDVYGHLVGYVKYGDDGAVRATSFHAPEVLYETLARCDSDAAEDFFGPITAFLSESENPDELLRFQRAESGVTVETFPIGA